MAHVYSRNTTIDGCHSGPVRAVGSLGLVTAAESAGYDPVGLVVLVILAAASLASIVHLAVLLRGRDFRTGHNGLLLFVMALVFFPVAPLFWLSAYATYVRPRNLERRRAALPPTRGHAPDRPAGEQVDTGALSPLGRLATARRSIRASTAGGVEDLAEGREQAHDVSR